MDSVRTAFVVFYTLIIQAAAAAGGRLLPNKIFSTLLISCSNIFPEVGAAGVMVESHHQSPPPPRTAVVDDSVRVAPNTPKTSTNNTANRFEL